MIKVLLTEKDNKLGIEITGHSRIAAKGQDILCAAVSAMAQMIEIGLTKILGLKKNSRKKKAFSF